MTEHDGIPRRSVEPDPGTALMSLFSKIKKQIEEIQRNGVNLRNASISGGEGLTVRDDSGRKRTVLRGDDGALVILDSDENQVARFGPLISEPGAYGGEIFNPTTGVWLKLLRDGALDWSGISNPPTAFPPTPHQHSGTDITTAVANATNSTNAGTAALANGSSRAYNNTVAGTNFFAVWVGNDSGNSLGKNTSSRRYKQNIRHYQVDPAEVLKLRPVVFDRKPSMLPAVTAEGAPAHGPAQQLPGARDEYGLIAEEVHQNLPEIVSWYDAGDGNGPQIDGVRYDLLGVALLDVVKKQQTHLDLNDDRIAALEAAVRALGGTL